MRTKYILLLGKKDINHAQYSIKRGMPSEDTFTDIRNSYLASKDIETLGPDTWQKMEVHDLETGEIKYYSLNQ